MKKVIIPKGKNPLDFILKLENLKEKWVFIEKPVYNKLLQSCDTLRNVSKKTLSVMTWDNGTKSIIYDPPEKKFFVLTYLEHKEKALMEHPIDDIPEEILFLCLEE